MSIVGERIRERRNAQKLSQEKLADLIQTSQKQVSRYESGLNEPTANVIVALIQALNTSADYLLGVVDDPTPSTVGHDLTSKEQQVIAALRRRDKLQAMQIIMNG